MAHPPEVTNMALFCDFENVALGVQDAKYRRFDIGKVLERLLLKGSIVIESVLRLGSLQGVPKAPMHGPRSG
jgi:hypothetical protein